MRKSYTPKEYQKIITNFQSEHGRCCVWAGMGLGKTVSTLTDIDNAITCGESRPTLIIAPLRVAQTVWPEEVTKWHHLSGLSVSVIGGTDVQRRRALANDAAIYTINIENIEWLVSLYGKRWPFGRVVVDESTKLKSFRTKQGGKRAKALAQVAHTYVDNLVELTGTPAPNGLLDLWGQLWFVDKGERLGRSFTAFKQRWFRPTHDGFGSIALPHAQAEIEALIADVCLTIRTEDWFDLEKPIVNNIYVGIGAKATAIYREMEKNLLAELENGSVIEAANSAAKSMKLLQIANGAAYTDDAVDTDADPRARQWRRVHDAKLQALDDVQSEADGPVLVGYHFRSDLVRLMQAFPGSADLRDADQMRDFKAGKYKLGFGHPAGMGHGVDGLQNHCHTLCFFGHNWNLEERLQFIERVGPVRQMQAGTNKVVTIHNILARDTIDEVVVERMDGKKSIQDALLDAMRRRHK